MTGEEEKYLLVLICICVLATIDGANEGDLSVCNLDDAEVNVARGGQFTVECSCAFHLPQQRNQMNWTLDEAPLIPRNATDSNFWISEMRDVTVYTMKGILTVKNVDRDISGCLRCSVSHVHSVCLSVKVYIPPMVEVSIQLKELYKTEGSNDKTNPRWIVLIYCTVTTENPDVRDSVQFLPTVNGKEVTEPYTSTTKRQIAYSNYSLYLKIGEIRREMEEGSRVECRLQGFDELEFGPEGRIATTFSPLAVSTPTGNKTNLPSGTELISRMISTSSFESESKSSDPDTATWFIPVTVTVPVCVSILLSIVFIGIWAYCRKAPASNSVDTRDKQQTGMITEALDMLRDGQANSSSGSSVSVEDSGDAQE